MRGLPTLPARVRDELADDPHGPEAASLLDGLSLAVRLLSSKILRAPLAGLTGLAGRRNIQGEEVARLDELAHETMTWCLSETGVVGALVSEESGEPVFPDGEGGSLFSVCFDPLDGSSNIDVGVSIGTIFSVHRHDSPPRSRQDLLRPGREQYLAGYAVYGSCTSLVLAAARGVSAFTLDPTVGEFFQTHGRIAIPRHGKIYSANESNVGRWHPGLRRYIEHLKEKDPVSGRPYTARYVGSLVADFHRNLLRGGIFLYPAEIGDGERPSGKLRLMYEANPLAFIAEKAGGAASTGEQRVLDVVPSDLHQRVPLLIGSSEDVEAALEFLSGAR